MRLPFFLFLFFMSLAVVSHGQTCDCKEYIYLNEIANGGRVHKFEINPDGTVTEVNPIGTWYPNGGNSELPAPHGLGTDLNGYLYIGSSYASNGSIRRLTCDGNIIDAAVFSIPNVGIYNLTSIGNLIYANGTNHNHVSSYNTCDGSLVDSLCFNNIPYHPDFPWMEQQGDWGLFYDKQTGFFYSAFPQDYADDTTWVADKRSVIYRYTATDFFNNTCVDPFVESPAGAIFGEMPAIGAPELPLTNISGITTDTNGNIYYIATGYLEPGQIVKLDPNGNFLAASAIDDMDGDGGFWGARAITYSTTSNRLYVSTQTSTITEDCIAIFDTNLNYIGAAVFAGGTTGNAGSGKAMAVNTECCPLFSNEVSVDTTVCAPSVGTDIPLISFLPCEFICAGDWTEVSNDAGIFNDCNNSLYLSTKRRSLLYV